MMLLSYSNNVLFIVGKIYLIVSIFLNYIYIIYYIFGVVLACASSQPQYECVIDGVLKNHCPQV